MKSLMTCVIVFLASGLALAMDGEPIPGANVKVGRKPPGSGQIVAEAKTGADGKFKFKNLPEGTYFVQIVVSGTTHEIRHYADDSPIVLPAPVVGGGAETGTRQAKAASKIKRQMGSAQAVIWVQGNTIRGVLKSKLTKADSKR